MHFGCLLAEAALFDRGTQRSSKPSTPIAWLRIQDISTMIGCRDYRSEAVVGLFGRETNGATILVSELQHIASCRNRHISRLRGVKHEQRSGCVVFSSLLSRTLRPKGGLWSANELPCWPVWPGK